MEPMGTQFYFGELNLSWLLAVVITFKWSRPGSTSSRMHDDLQLGFGDTVAKFSTQQRVLDFRDRHEGNMTGTRGRVKPVTLEDR